MVKLLNLTDTTFIAAVATGSGHATGWQVRTSFMACGQRGSMLAWSLAPETVGMIIAYTAMLTPCWQPKSCGHQQTGYMTVQAIFVLASGERSIHDDEGS